MRRLRIAPKLILGFTICIILAGIIGAVALINLDRIKRDTIKIKIATSIEKEVGECRIQEKNIMLFGPYGRAILEGMIDEKTYLEKVNDSLTAIRKLIEDGKKVAEEEEEFNVILHEIKNYETSLQEVVAHYAKGEKEVEDHILSMRENGREVQRIALKIVGISEKRIDVTHRTAKGILWTTLILTIVFGGGVGVFLSRNITNPIRKLISITALIARGDLAQRVDIKSTDEIGELAQSFNKMAEDLKGLVQKEKELAAAEKKKAVEKKKAAELENAYRDLEVLKENLQERVSDLKILFEMNHQISVRLYLSDIVEYVSKSAPETMGAEICAILIWDEIKDRLIPKVVTRLSPEELENIPFLLGEGLEGWVGLEKKLTNIQDMSKDPRWKDKLPYHVDEIKTALFCPILMGEELLGVIGLINKVGEKEFNHSDESLLTAIATQLAVAMENSILYEKISSLSLGIIRSLARAIDARDPYTRGHSEKVAKYAVMIAKTLNFSQVRIEMMEIAGLLHDTGKIGIPEEILKKPGPLTHEDWDKIKLHPYLSRRILLPVKSLNKILPWVYHHHERPDSQGYPNGLSGKEIPLEAKILAVADTYSALTSDRPYRKAKTEEETIEEIKRVAGTQLDPKIVEVFIKALGEEDPGEVKL